MKRYSGTGRLRLWTWVFMSMRLGFATLLALGLLTGAAGADNQKVRLNGKLLDDIPDILVETGNANREIPKQSLLITSWSSNNDMRWDINTVDSDGSSTTIKNLTESGHSLGTRNAGLHTAVSRGTDNRGHRLALTAMNNGDNGIVFRLSRVGMPTKDENGNDRVIVRDEDVELSLVSNGSFSSTQYTPRAVVTDVRSGLYVGGQECFVVATIVGLYKHKENYRIGSQVPGSQALKDVSSDHLWTHYDVWIIPINSGYASVGTPVCIDSGDSKGLYCVARVDTGDLNNNGTRDEVVIVRSVYANGDKYQLLVKTVTGTSGSTSTLLDTTLGSKKDSGQLRWIDGVDVAVGDFDGDCQDEFVAAYNNRDDKSSYLGVEVFNWNGKGFENKQTLMNDNNDYRLSNYDVYKNGITHSYGLMVRTGDIDGDGIDEFVTLTARAPDLDNDGSAKAWLNVTAWEWSSGANPSLKYNKFLKDADIYLPSNQHSDPHRYINSYFYRCFDMVVAPILGQVNTKITATGAGSVADVAISWAASSGTDDWEYEDGKAGTAGTCQRVYVLASVLDSSGSFQGFTDPKQIWKLDGMGTVGIAAADLACESLILGEPAHIKTTAFDEYLSIFQVPPYHVDTIKTPVPWEGNSTTAPANLSYTGSAVTFSRSTSSSESKNHTHSVYTSNSYGWGLGAGSEGDNQGAMGRAAIWKDGGIRKGWSFSGSANYAGSYLDGNTEETSESSAVTTGLSTSISTNTYDLIQYNASDLHLWMYPVAKPVRASMAGGDGTKEENVGDVFYTFTMLDNPAQKYNASNSSALEDYAVTHEEGNLFSYPQSVTKIPGYDGANELYDDEFNLDSDAPSSHTFSFVTTSSKSETDTTQTNHSESPSFAGNGGLFSSLLKISGNFKYTYNKIETDIQTATSSYSESENVNIVANTSNSVPGRTTIGTGYSKYDATGQLFKDASGILIMGFAVNFDDNAWLWSTSNLNSLKSPYAQKPDPALVLPGRYMLSNGKWTMSRARESATLVRGLRVYEEVLDSSGNKKWAESDTTLVNGTNYKFSVPLYNASLRDAGSVEVRFRWQGKNDEAQEGTIGTYTVNLGAWIDGDMNEGNKGKVEFDWKPDLPEGNYYLFIDVDPDDKLDEVHEAWSEEFASDGKSGPDGNNTGYKPFAIVPKTVYVNDAGVSLAGDKDVSESNFKLVFRDLANPDVWMDKEEFREYAIAQPGTFIAEQHVTYDKNAKLLTRAKFVLNAITNDGRESVLLQRNIPAIWPGEEWHLLFHADPEKIKDTHLAADLFCAEGYFQSERPSNTNGSTTSSSGGCSAGFGGLALLALAALWGMKSGKGK